MTERLLRRSEVEKRIGLRRSAIYERISKGTFPEPVRFRDTRAVRWRASEIEKWLADQTVS
ncbi:helix-turn-helix transcriptional regulator [Alteraurantiacibacter palmitatis]|uniref:Helix-turn-helix transcriptional regulator n=1 Tax=Alteraurantiacibacter palmitatis TaxID=2054628 RepID=A0ABV7E640_9SPHN